MEPAAGNEKIFMRTFFRKVGKAIYDYELIREGDRILVGVSGGKDSLALLEVLALRARDPKQHYTVVAAHIDVENVAYEVDSDYLQAFCDRLGVKYLHRTVRIDPDKDPGKPVCFVCSWFRRKALFEIARGEGCGQLALGHHRDDAVESLLMSMVFNATVSSMPATLDLFGGTFRIIRPLIYLSDEETKAYAAYRDFKKQKKYCPYERSTNREAIRQVIDRLEVLCPHARNNLFAAMRNIRTEYLPGEKVSDIGKKDFSGEDLV